MKNAEKKLHEIIKTEKHWKDFYDPNINFFSYYMETKKRRKTNRECKEILCDLLCFWTRMEFIKSFDFYESFA